MDRRASPVRTTVAVVGVLVLAAAVGLVSTAWLDDDEAGGSGTAADPTGLEGRWLAIAFSAVTTGSPERPFIELDPTGRLRGSDGCNTFATTWSVVGDTLETGPVESTAQRCEDTVDTGMTEIIADDPLVETFDGQPGTLQLRSGDRFVAFARP